MIGPRLGRRGTAGCLRLCRRSQEGAGLKRTYSFAGILQVDGYGGYAMLARRRQQIGLAFCWAYVRRKFYVLADSSPVATEALRRIAQLYVAEDEVRGSSAQQRQLVHSERRRVMMRDLRQFSMAADDRSAPNPSSAKRSATRSFAGTGTSVSSTTAAPI